ncbi:DUF6314 family protein [Streptomyces sp. NPDC091292]|uniref:DUF6314 family protein n=1 Tax=Streptomyces sp. NPDC091292 TaxID=3365991 RepID=UPI0037F2F6F5
MGEYRSVPDVLAYLAGRWRVERVVRDLAGGAAGEVAGEVAGRFTGTTDFSPLEPAASAHGRPGLLHHESGTFVWQGVARPAERTLRYLPGDPAGTARVEFSDGRPFHDLDLRTGHWVADHPCAADLYRGTFTVDGDDDWRTEWRVRGPAKDLVLSTTYHRDNAYDTDSNTYATDSATSSVPRRAADSTAPGSP